MSETAIKVSIPLKEIGIAARGAALVSIELLGLKADAIIKHPDFIDGATVETVLSTAIATVAKNSFAQGSRAGAEAAIHALGGTVSVVEGGIYGNAAG